jgi:NAD-dependent SIR2 family protein deacetylase
MMAEERHRTCPECGGTHIDKEYLLGMDTGDLKCAHCGFAAHRNDEAWYGNTAPDANELAARIVDEATKEGTQE